MSNERIEGKERKEHGKAEEKIGKEFGDKGRELAGKEQKEFGKVEEKMGKQKENEGFASGTDPGTYVHPAERLSPQRTREPGTTSKCIEQCRFKQGLSRSSFFYFFLANLFRVSPCFANDYVNKKVRDAQYYQAMIELTNIVVPDVSP